MNYRKFSESDATKFNLPSEICFHELFFLWPRFSSQKQCRDSPLCSSSSLTLWLDGSLSVMSDTEDSQSWSSLLMPHTFSWHFIWSQGKIPAEISFSIISWQMALLARALTLRSPLIGFYSPASPPLGFYYLMAHWLMPQCPDGPEHHRPLVGLSANLLFCFWFQ